MTRAWRDTPAFFLLVLGCLYFAQGLPFGLLAKALPAMAREAGMGRAWIGLLALPAAPWALKFIWAPWVDRLGAGRRWHRKAWVIGCQSAAALLLVVVASRDPARLFADQWWLLLLLLTLLNSVCATQDVATDGLAARLLPLSLRGVGNSLQVTGYKVGLILGGASILMLVDVLGWQTTLLAAALLLLLLLVPLLLWVEPRASDALPVAGRNGWRWWLKTLLELFRRPGMGLWLLVLMAYRTGEDFGEHMIKPWLVDAGWSLAVIGRLELVTGLFGLLAAVVCGFWLRHAERRRPLLLLFAILQVFAMLGWAWLVRAGADAGWVWGQAFLQQGVTGMAAVVFMTLMMDRCRAGHEGADFTVQVSVQLSVTGSFVLLSGVSAEWLGYANHFLLAAALAAFAILPILLLPRHFFSSAHD